MLNKRRTVTLAITLYYYTSIYTNPDTHTQGTPAHIDLRHIDDTDTYTDMHTHRGPHTWIQTNTHTPKYPHRETNTSGKTYMITCNRKSYFHSLIRFLQRAKSQYDIMLESTFLWIWITVSYQCM